MHERRDVPRTLHPTRTQPGANDQPQGQAQVRYSALAPPPRTAANPRAAMRPLRQGRRDRTSPHRDRERPIPPPASIVVHELSFRVTPEWWGGTSESRPARGAAPPPRTMPRKLTTGVAGESCDVSYPSSLEHPSTTFGSRRRCQYTGKGSIDRMEPRPTAPPCASGSRRGAPRRGCGGALGCASARGHGAGAEGRPFPTLNLSGQPASATSPKGVLRSNPSNGPILAAADPRGRVGAPGSVRQPPPDAQLRAPVRSTG